MPVSMRSLNRLLLAATAFVLLPAPPARAQFVETEDNNTKATANAFTLTAPGNTIQGLTTGTSTTTPGPGSADYFLLTLPTATPGIYRNRLVITTAGTAGHTGTIRGLSQSNRVINPTSDAAFQTSSAATTPARFNQWYSFGQGEQIYHRLTGTATTTTDYTTTWEREAVTPTVIPTEFAEGTITITTAGQTTVDTVVLVYDANLNPIPGYRNDDTFNATNLQSTLTRTFGPGTYFLAVSNFNTADNQPSAADDDSTAFSVLDFAGALANSSTTTNADIDFTITDSIGTMPIAALKLGPYDVNWYQFTVVPEPGSVLGVCVAAAAVLVAARRRGRAGRAA